MLHHHHRIAQLLELAQYAYQLVRVPAMQSDARLVQYIKTPHQAASQRRGQVDTLALTTRQRVTQPVQRQVAQPYIYQEADAAVDFRQYACGHLGIVGVQLQVVEEHFQLSHRQVH